MDDYLTAAQSRGLLDQTLRKWLAQGCQQPHAPRRRAKAAPPAARHRSGNVHRWRRARRQWRWRKGWRRLNRSIDPGAGALDQEVIRDLLDVMGEEFTAHSCASTEDTPKNIQLLQQAAGRQDVRRPHRPVSLAEVHQRQPRRAQTTELAQSASSTGAQRRARRSGRRGARPDERNTAAWRWS